ncbi:unnamed protein product, partial [Medioppia subpectinata]
MNSGTILKQSNPNQLMAEYQVSTLEEVFLRLCQQDIKRRKSRQLEAIESQTRKTIQLSDVLADNTDDQFEDNNPGKLNKKPVEWCRIKAMLWKYYILTLRRPLYLFMYYSIPIIALTAMNYTISQSPYNIPVAIVNADLNPKLSQLYLDSIDPYFLRLTNYPDNQSAIDSIVKGKNYMSIAFSENFSDTFETRITDVFDLTDFEVEENAAIGAFLVKYMIQAFKTFLDRMSSIMGGRDLFRILSPLQIQEAVYGDTDLNITNHFGPSILIVIAQILPLVISAFQIVIDRKNSSFERVFVAGVKPIEYFMAHMAQNMLLCLTQVTLSMTIMFIVFNATQLGSYVEIFIMLLLQGLLGISIGLMGALILADEVSVAVWFTVMLQNAHGCNNWIYAPVMDNVGPITIPLNSLRSVMLRGWSYTRMTVLYGYIVSAGYSLIINSQLQSVANG